MLWILPRYYGNGFVAPLKYCGFGLCGLWNFMLEEIGWGEWIVATDARIFGVVLVSNGGIFDVEACGLLKNGVSPVGRCLLRDLIFWTFFPTTETAPRYQMVGHWNNWRGNKGSIQGIDLPT
jgi:hypothetical protein